MLIPRIGPKPPVTAGMLISATGMLWPTRLDLDSTYAADVLPRCSCSASASDSS
jgi:hypothetical protein